MLKILIVLFVFLVSFAGIYFFLSAFLKKFRLRKVILPGFVRHWLNKKRMEKFDQQLLDGLVLIANSLRAGASFGQALEILAREAKPPLAEEFAKVSQETKLGKPMGEALEQMAGALQSEDLKLVVLVVNTARETGGNLSEVLLTVAETMRERRKIQGKIKALTAQGKLSGFIVGGMPFFLIAILYFMAPEMVEPLFTTNLGILMLVAVVILVALGGILIKKIVTIDI